MCSNGIWSERRRQNATKMPLAYVFGGWGFEIAVNTFCIGFLGNGVLSRACSYALSWLTIKLHLDKAIRLWHLVCAGRLNLKYGP